MNAKRLIVTLVFTTILIGFFVWIIDVALSDAARKNRIWREQAQKVVDAVDYMNNARCDIMYYGEDLNGPQSLRVRHIYDFEQESLAAPAGTPEHDKHMIIVNDPNNNIPISKDQWLRLLDLIQHEGYVIVYLGAAQLPVMQEVGFFFDVYPASTHSIVFWDGGAQKDIGFADTYSRIPEVVAESLTSEQKPVYTMIVQMAEKKYI